MNRRQFISRTAYGIGAGWLGTRALQSTMMGLPPLLGKFAATDTVTLGNTGIKTSRLAMGTGTVGFGGHSHQSSLGVKGLSELLLNGHDQGLRLFDSADSYGSHPHVAEALKHDTVVSVIREMKAAGKGIVGMKILGQGDLRNRQDEAIKYALSLGLLDAFTIGAENKSEQQDLMRRIGSAA